MMMMVMMKIDIGHVGGGGSGDGGGSGCGGIDSYRDEDKHLHTQTHKHTNLHSHSDTHTHVHTNCTYVIQSYKMAESHARKMERNGNKCPESSEQLFLSTITSPFIFLDFD